MERYGNVLAYYLYLVAKVLKVFLKKWSGFLQVEVFEDISISTDFQAIADTHYLMELQYYSYHHDRWFLAGDPSKTIAAATYLLDRLDANIGLHAIDELPIELADGYVKGCRRGGLTPDHG